MNEAPMPKRAKTRSRAQRVKVGDRVRVRVGSLSLVGDVVEDRGDIGVGGRHAVAVSVRNEAGELEKFDWPADKLTVLRRAVAKK